MADDSGREVVGVTELNETVTLLPCRMIALIEPDSDMEGFSFPGAGAVARFGKDLVRGGAIGVATVVRAFKGGPKRLQPDPCQRRARDRRPTLSHERLGVGRTTGKVA
jgi:hypothetical protein